VRIAGASLLRVPFFCQIGPRIVFGLVFASLGLVRNALKEIMKIDLVRPLERSSFFEPTMTTLFHVRTS
jgi:hypothetical protein